MGSMWKKIREDAGLTQMQFAEKVGSSKNTISQYETGYRKMPIRLQIEYLKLRNSSKDKMIIDYLKGEL